MSLLCRQTGLSVISFRSSSLPLYLFPYPPPSLLFSFLPPSFVLPSSLSFFLLLLLFFFFPLLGPNQQHMEVPRRSRIGAAAARLRQSHSNARFNPCLLSTPQFTATRILNPLSKARDHTRVFMDTSQVCYYWATMGTPVLFRMNRIWWKYWCVFWGPRRKKQCDILVFLCPSYITCSEECHANGSLVEKFTLRGTEASC